MTIFTSSPLKLMISPAYNLRPRLVSASPFTQTIPSVITSFASAPDSTRPDAFKACPSLIYSSLNLITSNLIYLSELLYLNYSVKINRKNQIDIALLIILNKTRRLRIHQIQHNFFVVDHPERVDQELRIEAYQQILAFFVDIDLFIHGTDL